MGCIRYIGDMHLGHENVIKHDNRPFRSAKEMDKLLIEYYNSVVNDEDDVYIVGDFCYKSAEDPCNYLKKLKGKKHLVIGNHDGKLLTNKKAMSYFVDSGSLYDIVDNNRRVIICHYPLAEWNGMFRGAYHVYAHIHNNKNEAFSFMKNKEKAFNSGCMINNYIPVTLEELEANNKINVN